MDYPFTTDECSGGMSASWRLLTGRHVPWAADCIAHDREYWRGGTVAQRVAADLVLFEAVSKYSRVVAWAMWLAVRAGGHPLLPFPWRWGYGWAYPHVYHREA